MVVVNRGLLLLSERTRVMRHGRFLLRRCRGDTTAAAAAAIAACACVAPVGGGAWCATGGAGLELGRLISQGGHDPSFGCVFAPRERMSVFDFGRKSRPRTAFLLCDVSIPARTAQTLSLAMRGRGTYVQAMSDLMQAAQGLSFVHFVLLILHCAPEARLSSVKRFLCASCALPDGPDRKPSACCDDVKSELPRLVDGARLWGPMLRRAAGQGQGAPAERLLVCPAS